MSKTKVKNAASFLILLVSVSRLFQPKKMSFMNNNKKTFLLLSYNADNADSVLGIVLYCASSCIKHLIDNHNASFCINAHKMHLFMKVLRVKFTRFIRDSFLL